MDLWLRRVDRAAALARQYPFSAELMYFYRDIVQARLPISSPEAPRGFDTALDAFLDRLLADPGQCRRPLSLIVYREASRVLLCPYCDESRAIQPATCPVCSAARLLIHKDAEFPHMRVEACDSCATYVKAVDLNLDPGAIPEVDDLASVPLDIWAASHGYRKPALNLFGL
jgi:formate dehydrogenase maturation protein FdhE